jgi:hypothetical protein
MTTVTGSRRFSLARPATAWLLGGLLLALAITAVPMARLAHQSLNSSGGSVPVWISAAYGAVGVIVASHKPGNPLGWIFLAEGVLGCPGTGQRAGRAGAGTRVGATGRRPVTRLAASGYPAAALRAR